jgi:hypothetical protein
MIFKFSLSCLGGGGCSFVETRVSLGKGFYNSAVVGIFSELISTFAELRKVPEKILRGTTQKLIQQNMQYLMMIE